MQHRISLQSNRFIIEGARQTSWIFCFYIGKKGKRLQERRAEDLVGARPGSNPSLCSRLDIINVQMMIYSIMYFTGTSPVIVLNEWYIVDHIVINVS